jgi:hypothetical protein
MASRAEFLPPISGFEAPSHCQQISSPPPGRKMIPVREMPKIPRTTGIRVAYSNRPSIILHSDTPALVGRLHLDPLLTQEEQLKRRSRHPAHAARPCPSFKTRPTARHLLGFFHPPSFTATFSHSFRGYTSSPTLHGSSIRDQPRHRCLPSHLKLHFILHLSSSISLSAENTQPLFNDHPSLNCPLPYSLPSSLLNT